MIPCWCGNTRLKPFSPSYRRCQRCQTLVSQEWFTPNIMGAADDARDFYGQQYWLGHQVQELGFPDIYTRARTDLPERCLYWLRTLLKYKLPPAITLELGGAHGGSVALFRWAGFDATNLELSPWVVEFSRHTFNVPTLLGPIEDQSIAPASLDVIAMMDVLEHLPDPLATLRHCLPLLKPEGLFLIQTPQFPEELTYQQMQTEESRFLELLKPDEHLYLLSQRAIQTFFQRLEVPHLIFEPAIFAHYDMFLVVSRHPLSEQGTDAIHEALRHTAGGRLVQALLDLDAQKRDLYGHYTAVERNRAFQMERVQVLEEQVEAAETQCRRQAETIESLQHKTERLEADIKHRAAQNQLVQQTPSVSSNAIPSGIQTTRIVVDLTPLLPGSENGGAKIMTLELIQQLSKTAPELEFLLLTTEQNHDGLAFLDTANVWRRCVTSSNPVAARRQRLSVKLQRYAREKLTVALPSSMLSRLRKLYRSAPIQTPRSNLLRGLRADLLFCPFTAPLHYDSTVPVVSVIYDLQYLYYPEFFSPEERIERDKNFRDACHLAQHVICISDYVRDTVLAHADLHPEQVTTVHIQLGQRLDRVRSDPSPRVLDQLGLQAERFLLYPANFWPHKNHRMLLTAFAIYHARHPDSSLKLVCTGTPDAHMQSIQDVAERMGLATRMVFPGYLADEDFRGLLQACLALIFPSLYEGFGMPLLEAMALDKPVLCSNVTSLPEIAGEAALLFDPRKPADIVNAIERIESDETLRTRLICRGAQRLSALGNPESMARQYLQVFRTVGA